jgi:hypothetical protein
MANRSSTVVAGRAVPRDGRRSDGLGLWTVSEDMTLGEKIGKVIGEFWLLMTVRRGVSIS